MGRIHYSGSKEPYPMKRKIEVHITDKPSVGYYVSVEIRFIGSGHSRWLGFPCKHSPSVKAIKAKLEMLKEVREYFNTKGTIKRFGSVYKLIG